MKKNTWLFISLIALLVIGIGLYFYITHFTWRGNPWSIEEPPEELKQEVVEALREKHDHNAIWFPGNNYLSDRYYGCFGDIIVIFNKAEIGDYQTQRIGGVTFHLNGTIYVYKNNHLYTLKEAASKWILGRKQIQAIADYHHKVETEHFGGRKPWE